MTPKPNYDRFPEDKTPALQDVARQLEQDLKRLRMHFQLLQSDKVTLEGEFARFKKATRKLVHIGYGVSSKWKEMTVEVQDRLVDCGFKPEDFE